VSRTKSTRRRGQPCISDCRFWIEDWARRSRVTARSLQLTAPGEERPGIQLPVGRDGQGVEQLRAARKVARSGAAAVAGAGKRVASGGAGTPPTNRGIEKTRIMQKPECRYQKSELTEEKGLGTGRRGRSQKAGAKSQNRDAERWTEGSRAQGEGRKN
jgi:hypothetical protein